MDQDLNTARSNSPNLLLQGSEPSSGCNSPRTKIARKLGSLDLDTDDHAVPYTPRKRTRLSSEEVVDVESNASSSSTGTLPHQTSHDSQASEVVFTSQNRLLPSHLSLHHGELNQVSQADTTSQSQQSRLSHFLHTSKPNRLRSPPPPPYDLERGKLGDHAEQPPSDLVWRDSEITGMAVDFAAGDDGTGLNGIAFRPTPQVAHARRQRRRQQVSEWKAREAREARIKRLERRNGRLIEGEALHKRLVRFVEPGS